MNNVKIPYIVYPVVLGLVFGWFISIIISSMFMTPKALPVPKIQKTEQKIIPIGTQINSAVERNIFELETSVSSIQEEVNTENSLEEGSSLAPPPPFLASLIGLIYDETNNSGIAVITLDTGTISILKGSEKEGITLLDLGPNYATIEKDKKRYSLLLDENKEQSTQYVQKEASPPLETGVKVSDSGANINITVPRDELKSELQDLNKVLQSGLISPFYENGVFAGYRVARLKPDSPLRKLGLDVGDVLTRMNGSDIKPQMLFEMLSQLDDVSAINIDMIRNNEKKSVFVEIQ